MRARRWRAAALTVVATLALTACSSSGTSAGANAASQMFASGKRVAAPAVTGTLLAGATFDLSADRGHVVVVNFWGSWCAPCRSEAADLQSVYASGAADFVGVNVRDDHDAASAYVSAHQITYPSIFDPSGRVALAFRNVPPSSVPATIVIDPAGKIAGIHFGAISTADLKKMISAAGQS
jgi:thiol-disulfide isomerase/thioredoxin